MTIYVVRTPDGDRYFSGARNASIDKAYDVATEVVLANVPRLGGETYSAEDVAEASRLKGRQNWSLLYMHLVSIGAVRMYTLED